MPMPIHEQLIDRLPARSHILLHPDDPPTISPLEWEHREEPYIWQRTHCHTIDQGGVPSTVAVYDDSAYGYLALAVDGHVVEVSATGLIIAGNLIVADARWTGNRMRLYQELSDPSDLS